MRLQVEHHLQSMFNLTQKCIVFLEQNAFLIGQAAGVLQFHDCIECIGRANACNVATIEQL